MIKGIIFLLDLVWMGKKRNQSYTWRKYWMNEFFGTKLRSKFWFTHMTLSNYESYSVVKLYVTFWKVDLLSKWQSYSVLTIQIVNFEKKWNFLVVPLTRELMHCFNKLGKRNCATPILVKYSECPLHEKLL